MPKCAASSAKPARLRLPKENSRKYAEQYIKDVKNGKEIACKWVKKAIDRHLRDLKGLRGFYFDSAAGEVALKSYDNYKHFKGKWAGQTFILLPWEQAIVYILFGWKRRKTGLRRFRTAYIEVARKNGKSHLAAGMGLYMLDLDGEPAAEVYSAATKRDQAKIVHTAAKQMVRGSADLKRFIKVYKDSLAVEDTASVFEPLSADYNSLDGLNVSCAIVDELHAHKVRDLYDVLDTATGAREQPLIIAITTAGIARESVCREMHEYTENILNDIIKDETFFGIIYTLDDGDDWADSSVWIKANPSLGAALDYKELDERAQKAKNSAASRNAFLRLRMNIWTTASESWIDYESWEASAGTVDEKKLLGCACFAGLDLSTTRDISAVCLVFPQEDGTVKAIWRYFLPEDDLSERCRIDRVPYDVWARQGYLTLTPGNVIDYDFIEEEIKRLAAKYNILEVAYDPYNATQLVNHLIEAGMTCVNIRQGMISLSPPTKALEQAIMRRTFHHGNNPVTNWMIPNCEVLIDSNGNIKLNKAAKVSRKKIDGVVAAILGFGRIDATPVIPPKKSVYEERGLIML